MGKMKTLNDKWKTLGQNERTTNRKLTIVNSQHILGLTIPLLISASPPPVTHTTYTVAFLTDVIQLPAPMTCRRRHDARGCFTGEEEVGTDELLSTCQHRLPRQPTVFTRSPVRGEGQRVRVSPGCENMKRHPPLYPHLYHGRVLFVCLSLHQLSLTSFPLLLRFLSVDPTPRCSCMQLYAAVRRTPGLRCQENTMFLSDSHHDTTFIPGAHRPVDCTHI